jgi:VanZ family protein
MRFVKTWLPVLLWAAIILSASNDSFSATESRGWLASVIGAEWADALNIAIRKLGHFIAYSILGLLGWRAERRISVTLIIALAVATTDEVRQSMMLQRTGTPWDVLLDLASAWLGMMAAKRMWPRSH